MPRKLIIILVTILALVLLIAGAAWWLLGNESFLKEQAGKTVSSLTGRQLQIEGPLDLQLGALTTLHARDVSLSNAPWADGENMLEVGRLKVSLDLMSLFSEQVDIREINLDGVRVSLARNEQGDANWDMFPESAEDQKMERLPVRIGRLQVSDFQLTHVAPARERPLKAVLDSVLFELQANQSVDLSLSGSIDEQPLDLQGNAGPIDALVAGGAFSHKLELNLGDIRLNSQGAVEDISSVSGVSLGVNFTGPEFAWITGQLGLPEFSSGPFDFNLLLNTTGAMTEIDLKGDLGSLELVADGQVDKLLEPTELQLQLLVTGPDLQAMGETFGVPALPAVPYRVNLDTELETGRATINSLVAEFDSDRIEISGEIGARPDFHNSDLKFQATGSELSRWGPLLGVENLASKPFSVDGSINSDQLGALNTNFAVLTADSQLKIEGLLGLPPEFVGADLGVSFQAADLNKLAVLSSVADMPTVPASIAGRVGRSEQGVTFEDVVLDLADNEAKIDGLVSLGDDFEHSHLTARIDIPNVAALGRIFDVQDLPEQPFVVSGTMKPFGNGIQIDVEDGNLGDINLSLHGKIPDPGSVQGMEAQIGIDLPSLRLASFLVDDVELPDLPFKAEGLVRSEGKLTRVSGLHVNIGDNVIKGAADLTAEEDFAGSTITIDARGPGLGQILPLPELQSLPQDFSVSGRWAIRHGADTINDAELRLGSMSFKVNGSVDDLPAPSSFLLGIQAEGPDISLLNELLGQSLRPEAFKVKFGFDGSLEAFRLENLQAELGQSDLQGNLRIRLGDDPAISGTLISQFLDVSQWLGEESEEDEEDEEKTPEATAPESEFVFPETSLVQTDEQELDVDLDLTLSELDNGHTSIFDIRLGVLMTETQLDLDPLQFRGDKGGSFQGMIHADGTTTVPNLVARLEGQDLKMGLLASEGQSMETYPPMDIFLDIKGAGTTYREMASSLDGRVRLYLGAGQIANSGIGFIFSDMLTELFSTLNPFAKSSPYTQLDCSVFAADIVSGMVTVDPIIMHTEQITILSNGAIDLNTEKIDLTFNTKVRKGIGISAGMVVNPLIKLGGSLAAPAVELDPAGAVISGGTAVATVGLSLLYRSLADRYFSSKDPCGKARGEIEKRDAGLH